MAAAFGLPSGRIDYLTFVQLALNTPRARLQAACAVALGMQAANSDEPIDDAWGDALGSCKEEGIEIVHRANSARHESRVRRRLRQQQGGGGGMMG